MPALAAHDYVERIKTALDDQKRNRIDGDIRQHLNS